MKKIGNYKSWNLYQSHSLEITAKKNMQHKAHGSLETNAYITISVAVNPELTPKITLTVKGKPQMSLEEFEMIGEVANHLYMSLLANMAPIDY